MPTRSWDVDATAETHGHILALRDGVTMVRSFEKENMMDGGVFHVQRART